MYKHRILAVLTLSLTIWSCAGSNATTMEYRSATTAVRSEKDLRKGEEYALKALSMEEHANDGRVAYFLAVEIYKPRKDWGKMNEMLDIAMNRNPSQTIERPFRLDDGTVVKTIDQAVPIYKEQIWMNLFNQAVELIDSEQLDKATNKIILAQSVLEKVDNYITACILFLQLDDMENAKKNLNSALKLEPNNARVLEIAGDLAQNDEDFETALNYYSKALDVENLKNEPELIEKIIFVNVELEQYDEAILLSDKLLDNSPDDADTYFNVGVIYQRLASNLYDETVNEWKQITSQDKPLSSDIKENYNNFIQTLDFVKSALDYFMDSSMLEEDENIQTEQAIAEMKRTSKSIKNIYLDSIRQIAKDNNVDIN
ncbi:MAG: hypothetical protein CMG46_00105 [Candidatus Marinimicrobia bacterium]|nr:hypothetical protein [Candidatus Neomarinimicrobiota bacterium]